MNCHQNKLICIETNEDEKEKTVNVEQTHQHRMGFFTRRVYKHAAKTGIFNFIFQIRQIALAKIMCQKTSLFTKSGFTADLLYDKSQYCHKC